MIYKIRNARKHDDKELKKFWDEGKEKGFFVYNGDNKTLSDSWKGKKNSYVMLAVNDKRKIIGLCISEGKDSGRMKHRIELGWLVLPEYARKGIATRLLSEVINKAKKLGIRRIEAEIAINNKASIKLAKKLGFRKESKRKKGLLLDDGGYTDTYMFTRFLLD